MALGRSTCRAKAQGKVAGENQWAEFQFVFPVAHLPQSCEMTCGVTTWVPEEMETEDNLATTLGQMSLVG